MSYKTPTDISIGDPSLTTSTKETLLGILIDSDLSFDQHVSSICSKATNKLHALGRIASFMSFEKLRTLMKAYIEPQFNYFPLIWMFHSRIMNQKINRVHERALSVVFFFLFTSPLLVNYLKKADYFLFTTGTFKV